MKLRQRIDLRLSRGQTLDRPGGHAVAEPTTGQRRCAPGPVAVQDLGVANLRSARPTPDRSVARTERITTLPMADLSITLAAHGEIGPAWRALRCRGGPRRPRRVQADAHGRSGNGKCCGGSWPPGAATTISLGQPWTPSSADRPGIRFQEASMLMPKLHGSRCLMPRRTMPPVSRTVRTGRGALPGPGATAPETAPSSRAAFRRPGPRGAAAARTR